MRRTLLSLLAIASLAACQGPASTAPSADISSPVDGVIVAVDSSGLTDIRGFTLRTSRGVAIELRLGQLENAAEFSPSHLAEHMATSSPIRAWFRVEDGARVVYRLEDAPEGSPAAT